MTFSSRARLRAYMWAVVAVAGPLILIVGVRAITHATSMSLYDAIVVTIFALVLIVGEMYPIPVARGQEAGDEITVSSTFGFALLLTAPVFYAIAAQGIALAIDCFARKRPVDRLPFNIAQYALAFLGARAAYSFLSGQPFLTPTDVPAPVLAPALFAAGAFLLMNNLLVAVAIATSLQMRLANVLASDLKWQLATSAPLLGLGPLAAQAMRWSVYSIILLLLPIAALHHSGRLAMRREQEALRDALTGLANRAMITAAADRALSAGTGRSAMLLIDLDHFKDINDTLGHAVGDDMLKVVAERLTGAAGSDDLVGRLGGDEFVVLMRNVDDQIEAQHLADRICSALRDPVQLDGVALTTGCSIGIAFGPDHADTVPDLLRCADIALYAAKVTRDISVVYNKQDDRHSATLLGLQADLRAALEDEADNQIWVAYQPQLDLVTGTITSVECLARWRHPDLGSVDPDTFIPIAENTSLIDRLLDRVLDRAMHQLSVWDAEGFVVTACVNLSTRQIRDESLPATVAAALERHSITPHRLVLEVTESRLMADPELCAQILSSLSDMGVQISIDDFGTGYSSLGYLQRLAVHELKIDKSFTSELAAGGDATIVRSTVDLGHNLGLRVVAEGVEDIETAEKLAEIGCDVLQGYLIGRPAPASDTNQVLPGTVRTFAVEHASRRSARFHRSYHDAGHRTAASVTRIHHYVTE